MSENLAIALLTILGSVFATMTTYYAAMWINRKKAPAEVRQINAGADLSTAEFAEKMQSIAEKKTDENIKLEKEMEEKEGQNKELMAALNKLRNDMEAMDNRHNIEIENIKKSFETERAEMNKRFEDQKLENDRMKDWALRLVQQLDTWEIFPVPYDCDEAKKKKLSMGEFGSKKVDGSN